MSMQLLFGPQREKTCLRRFANNKGADAQSDLAFRKSTYLKLLQVKLVPIADETGLSLALSETPKTNFLTSRPTYLFFKGRKSKHII